MFCGLLNHGYKVIKNYFLFFYDYHWILVYIFNEYYYIMIQSSLILLAIYVNEEIETVEESNNESKIDELEKENELRYIRTR